MSEISITSAWRTGPSQDSRKFDNPALEKILPDEEYCPDAGVP
jgi:hypothetical protein